VKPDLGEAYVNRGAAFIGQHRYADGLTDLNKGIELGVEEPAKAYYNRALAYEGLDDIKSAYFDYQKAVELSPDWPAPKQELARFHVEHKE
jgi:tetratricopeptide (TPR) repeat protein